MSQTPLPGPNEESGSTGATRQNTGIGALLDGLPPLSVDKPEQTIVTGNIETASQADNKTTTGVIDQDFAAKTEEGSNREQLASSGLDQAELSSLPPGIAASLARLAGSTSGHGAGGPRRLSEGGSVRPGGSEGREDPTED